MTSYLIVIVNLFILESLLSVDNAAVLAIMVKDLPSSKRSKALKYGIVGAFVFRGFSLFLASWLIKILWLKIVGGVYLLYLVYGHFSPKKDTIEEGVDKQKNKLYLSVSNKIGAFWATVILVEFADMAFSIDNIFAAVAMSQNLYLILVGVFMGIVAMRFVAQWFVSLIYKYPSLENSAFIVIGILALKLIISGASDYLIYLEPLKIIMSSSVFDISFSGLMMLIFFTPLLKTKKYEIRKA